MNFRPVVFNTALSLLLLAACGSPSSQQKAADPGAAATSSSASAPAPTAAPAAAASAEAPHCFLGESDATDFAHELMLATLSSSEFNQARILKASTPENLKLLESVLQQQMFKVTCKKPWTDELDTIEGAILVLALMKFDDKQWDAAVSKVGVPQAYRALPTETQEWLKGEETLKQIKELSRGMEKTADELLAVAGKELKCGKGQVSVKVKARTKADVEGCGRKASLSHDGAWKRE